MSVDYPMHHMINCGDINKLTRDNTLRKKSNPADLIREIRIQLGLTQEKFAAKLGVTLPTINRWENGRTNPSPLAIQSLQILIKGMGREGQSLIDKYFPDEN